MVGRPSVHCMRPSLRQQPQRLPYLPAGGRQAQLAAHHRGVSVCEFIATGLQGGWDRHGHALNSVLGSQRGHKQPNTWLCAQPRSPSPRRPPH